jgi:3-phenylpropionate/cinnamic acid dioxygenase small subunit
MSATANTAAAVASDLERRAIGEFIRAETQLLDDRRFEEWMELFAEDGYYWAPIAQEQRDPLTHVSLFFDDKATMRTRIQRLRHPRIHMQIPHSRTVHVTSDVEVAPAQDSQLISARCNFIMLEYRPTRPQNVWGGRYDYRLVRSDGAYRIAMKKATLVSSDDQFPSLALWF